MSTAVAIASLVVAIAALGVSYWAARRSSRAVEIAEEEHKLRLAERAAAPILGIDIGPTNRVTGADGFIEVDASEVYVNLGITVTNTGTKPAGRTHVDVWVPAMISSTTLKWMDPSGGEQSRFGSSTPDPSTRLDNGDGTDFDTQVMHRTLESVPLVGETLHLRVACPIPVPGEGTIPVRVRVRTDGSDAETTYPIRLRRPKRDP